ncbi:hypothetical protein BX666DRAFT_1890504 [Dichotomocladium elegans]|nr:hypothetical protein BX666DRAFT_1890504 [Dichotomocladium elegans]
MNVPGYSRIKLAFHPLLLFITHEARGDQLEWLILPYSLANRRKIIFFFLSLHEGIHFSSLSSHIVRSFSLFLNRQLPTKSMCHPLSAPLLRSNARKTTSFNILFLKSGKIGEWQTVIKDCLYKYKS